MAPLGHHSGSVKGVIPNIYNNRNWNNDVTQKTFT